MLSIIWSFECKNAQLLSIDVQNLLNTHSSKQCALNNLHVIAVGVLYNNNDKKRSVLCWATTHVSLTHWQSVADLYSFLQLMQVRPIQRRRNLHYRTRRQQVDILLYAWNDEPAMMMNTNFWMKRKCTGFSCYL